MAMIGVRELREKTTEVLRRVREEKAEYIITHQGQPIAILLPVDADALETAMIEAGKRLSNTGGWTTYNLLAEELRRAWPADQATQPLMDELRGE